MFLTLDLLQYNYLLTFLIFLVISMEYWKLKHFRKDLQVMKRFDISGNCNKYSISTQVRLVAYKNISFCKRCITVHLLIHFQR